MRVQQGLAMHRVLQHPKYHNALHTHLEGVCIDPFRLVC